MGVQESTRDRSIAYYHIAGLTLGVTYIVMLLGAYTSAIGAGLACPDWPTCYGTWVPFLHERIIEQSAYSLRQIFAEWVHRTLAMIAGLLIAATALLAWRRETIPAAAKWGATIAFVLLPIQVFLGRLTVTRALKPVIVTTHLGTAILILLGLATATLLDWYVAQSATQR